MSNIANTPCEPGCACGACRGIRAETPVVIDNRPGLSAVDYRVGDHARFKESLLAGLSRSARPALRELSTRRGDDFSVALLDAFAVMADVLTFYQERIANESYLRTARERLSIGHIARLIGYQLRPGSAANVSLAFTMQEGPGAVEKLKLPVGTRVQSTPGPEEKAQVFETVEEVEVRPAWNGIPARAVREQELRLDTSRVRLKGGALNVRLGDGFLLVFPTSDGTDFAGVFRRVQSVKVEAQGRWTDVSLTDALAPAATFHDLTPPQTGPFVFRKQASLFGYNAPNYYETHKNDTPPAAAFDEWEVNSRAHDATHTSLDTVYRDVVAGSWGVWECASELNDPRRLFKVVAVEERGYSNYALSGKSTRLQVELAEAGSTLKPTFFYQLRAATVYVQSERLDLAEVPTDDPVQGDTIAFSRGPESEFPDWPAVVSTLKPGGSVAVQGKRLRAEVLKPVTLWLRTETGWIAKNLQPDERLDLLNFPHLLREGAITVFCVIQDGHSGYIRALPGQVRYRNDEDATELVTIAAVDPDGRSIRIDPPLAYRYDPPSVTLNANIAQATHGETVKEIFEGGDATRAFQRFGLKQTPLTYVAATTPSGTRSTLRVWADDVEWHEVPSLYGRGPNDRVFVTRHDGEGKTWIQFGDGVTGARLPTGQRNVRAEYRRGIGAEGIVKAGQINLLLTRPAGLKDAVNPLPSADGKDPEVLEDARGNAPLTVLTLDRVVSLQDYEDFARAFAGIYKAQGTWTWFRHTRGVFLTVAGFAGTDVSLEGREKLRSALAKWGDEFLPIAVENHAPVTFRTGLRIKTDPDREAAKVLEAVDRALRNAFSFDARSFGQAVTLAEVMAVAQGARGVVAVQVAKLYRTGGSNSKAGLSAPLRSRAPQPGERGKILPAELLSLDSAPFDLLEELK